MKLIRGLLAASAALSLAPVAAAQQVNTASSTHALVVGTMAYDLQGGEVGKIDSISGETIVIDTGTHKAALPKTAFGSGPKGPTVSMTKVQIDDQVAAASQKAAAALEAAMTPGAEVKGKAGTVIGTVKEVKGDQVIIERATGPVSLTKKAFGLGANGLFISLTAAELDAAAKKATSPS